MCDAWCVKVKVMRVMRHAKYYWPLSVTAGGDPLIGRNVAEGVPALDNPIRRQRKPSCYSSIKLARNERPMYNSLYLFEPKAEGATRPNPVFDRETD